MLIKPSTHLDKTLKESRIKKCHRFLFQPTDGALERLPLVLSRIEPRVTCSLVIDNKNPLKGNNFSPFFSLSLMCHLTIDIMLVLQLQELIWCMFIFEYSFRLLLNSTWFFLESSYIRNLIGRLSSIMTCGQGDELLNLWNWKEKSDFHIARRNLLITSHSVIAWHSLQWASF